MKAIEKLKLTKELRNLLDAIKTQKSMEKLSSAKRIRVLVTQLGGSAGEAVNALYQTILDGAEPTLELLKQLKEEAVKNLDHPQLRPAVQTMVDKVKFLVGT